MNLHTSHLLAFISLLSLALFSHLLSAVSASTFPPHLALTSSPITRNTCKSPLSTTLFVIGSYDYLPWRPEFSGKGVSVFQLQSHTFKFYPILNFPTSLISSNPTYVARFNHSFYVCNTKFPDGALTRIAFPARKTFPFGPPSVTTVAVPTGMRPAHIAVTSTGLVLIANVYGSAVLSYNSRLSKTIARFIVNPALASNVNERRQSLPNPHQVLPFIDTISGCEFVAVPDLGTDLIFILKPATLRQVAQIRASPGDGPRHAIHHKPSGNLFVVNELSQTVSTLCRNRAIKKPSFYVCQRWPILNTGPHVNGTSAAIRLSNDHKFLYVSTRRDSKFTPLWGRIVAFKISLQRGMIVKKLGQWSSYGVHPRDFFIAENIGRKCRSYVVVANRDSNNIVFIRRFKNTGKLGKVALVKKNVNTPSSVLQL